MVMLPCAAVQALCWLAATLWLRRTTGATVRECAKVLKKGGAGKVHVLTLARVVKEGYF